jgi:hypothetical protein
MIWLWADPQEDYYVAGDGDWVTLSTNFGNIRRFVLVGSYNFKAETEDETYHSLYDGDQEEHTENM